jgi:hypothetical protein
MPETISNISKLKKIDLMYCTEFETLAETIGNLGCLERQEFLGVYTSDGYNVDWGINHPYCYTETERKSPLTALPDTVPKLKALKFLLLNNTKITSLPDYLGGLPALEKIEIINCDIKTIPPLIQRLADNGKLLIVRTKDESRFGYLNIIRSYAVRMAIR